MVEATTLAYTPRLLRRRADPARARTPPQSSRREVPDATSQYAGTHAALVGSTMTITMGQLVCDLYAKYERELHDEQLAAVATEVRVSELLEGMPRRKTRGRKR